MPESLKRKAEAAATVSYREGPTLPDSMRHRGIDIAAAAGKHVSGANPHAVGCPQQWSDPADTIPADREELYAKPVDYERMDRGRVVID